MMINSKSCAKYRLALKGEGERRVEVIYNGWEVINRLLDIYYESKEKKELGK
jgi:hypothetical protein